MIFVSSIVVLVSTVIDKIVLIPSSFPNILMNDDSFSKLAGNPAENISCH